MKKERELAELIFDTFRASNCKTNEIVMMRAIRFGVIAKLNPKEKDIFFTVFNGLIFTGYFTYEQTSPECIRLTKKGYDYIYENEQVEIMLKTPWVIPTVDNTNWDKAYFKLWKIIGPQDTAIHYVGGSKFYKLIMDLCDDIPPSYSQYIADRREKDLSTSRVDYYKDLINHLEEDKRKEFYVNIQLFIEDNNFQNKNTDDELDLSSVFSDESSIMKKEPIKSTEQKAINTVTADETPTVFVSYSWDSQEHETWILELATKLRENGVNAILDKWDLGSLGKPLPNFMENAIANSQRVICVMTPNYKKKTDNLSGGVGYEYSIMTAEIFTEDINTTKFIPLFRSGTDADAIPTILKGRKYVDMRDDTLFDDKFLHELLRDIHNEPKFKKPGMGNKPTFE
jgi:hypothetical protein